MVLKMEKGKSTQNQCIGFMHVDAFLSAVAQIFACWVIFVMEQVYGG